MTKQEAKDHFLLSNFMYNFRKGVLDTAITTTKAVEAFKKFNMSTKAFSL